MPLNLDEILTGPRNTWVELTGPLAGIAVLVQYASPGQADRFRRRMRQSGVMKDSGEVADGRIFDFLREFCSFYVKDWRGATIGGSPAGYDEIDAKTGERIGPTALAHLMEQVGSAMKEITEAVSRQDAFFGNGGAI
jgi:hypothetical protein